MTTQASSGGTFAAQVSSSSIRRSSRSALETVMEQLPFGARLRRRFVHGVRDLTLSQTWLVSRSPSWTPSGVRDRGSSSVRHLSAWSIRLHMLLGYLGEVDPWRPGHQPGRRSTAPVSRVGREGSRAGSSTTRSARLVTVSVRLVVDSRRGKLIEEFRPPVRADSGSEPLRLDGRSGAAARSVFVPARRAGGGSIVALDPRDGSDSSSGGLGAVLRPEPVHSGDWQRGASGSEILEAPA